MGRIRELDGLRGIAAFVIMLAHLGWINDTPWVVSAVDFFFVISGYLITSNVLRTRHKPKFLSTFFVRRALRIWPAYYAGLAACLIINRSLKWDHPPDAWPYYLTFTQNIHDYFGIPRPRFSGMFLHTWTLAIEEQFYILWPLLLVRAGRLGVLATIATFVVLPPALRAWGFNEFLLLTRSDGLAIGSLLAILFADANRAAERLAAFRVGFAAILGLMLAGPALAGGFLPESPRFWDVFFTTRACLTYFGVAGLVLCLKGHRLLAPFRDARLCYLGTVSYGLYLYHPMIFAAVPRLYVRFLVNRMGVPNNPHLRGLFLLALCFAAAELSRRFLEAPFLALKDRLAFSRPAQVPGAVPAPHFALAGNPDHESSPVEVTHERRAG